MTGSRYEVDPGLQKVGRLLTRPTPSTPEGYRRQVRVVNALTRRRRRPGQEKSRVRGNIEVSQRWATAATDSPCAW